MKREAGILLPIYALPSPHGTGTLGKAAYEFADFLHAAGQSYWQMLPLGPTSYGDSPYQGFSTYAGNPYFIDLDMLVDDGLLTAEEVAACDGNDERYVNYEKLYEERFSLLKLACLRGWDRDQKGVEEFRRENRWVDNYAIYMACKTHFGMRPWTQWPEDIRLHKKAAVEEYKAKLQDDVNYYVYLQFLFYRQWEKLRDYIHKRGIRVIGDLPIYVAMDSADVWCEPQFFQLDEKGYPTAVGGVPPDYFAEDGQLWGNPLYDWDAMAQDGYGWWIRRIDGARKLYDCIRMDHFRGFDEYWAVPYGDTTARNGKWCKGPGMALVGVLSSWFCDVSYIAEDLGAPSPTVAKLLEDSGWPGMKVLEFAFDVLAVDSYRPHTYGENCICYTGTHDNSPLALWMEEADEKAVALAQEYFHVAKDDLPNAMLRGGMGSKASLFMAQMQDYLNLGRGHRTNTPGTAMGNWQWRMLPGEASKELAKKIRRMTALYGRCDWHEE